MFAHFRNIDTAFSHIKRFSLVFLIGCLLVCGVVVWYCFAMVKESQQRIYILAGGKAIEAFSTTRKDNLPVELRDHIRTFHHWFFTLDPDDKVIRANVGRALNLADESARKVDNNLKEQGYYNNIISANISQSMEVDSILLDVEQYPFYFRCYGRQTLLRSSSSVNRRLVTQGYVRNVGRSDNNPHGFLIQRWETLVNSDEVVKR